MQPIEVVLERQAEGVERQGEIRRELAGKMEHAAAAAIDPVDLDSQGLERFVVGPDMSTAAGTAHADRGRMLAQDQDRPPLFPQFVDDPTLKLLDLREVDQPQHIDFQRRQLRGWPHRRKGHRKDWFGIGQMSRPHGTYSPSIYTRKTLSGKWRSTGVDEASAQRACSFREGSGTIAAIHSRTSATPSSCTSRLPSSGIMTPGWVEAIR